LNIEGYPSQTFIDLVISVLPDQVTLVPDPPGAITSDQGWDTISEKQLLTEVISVFQSYGIRTSVFIGTDIRQIEHAVDTGTDRIELYTEPYAREYSSGREKAIEPFVKAAVLAGKLGLGLNAGHDLNLDNLKYFADNIPGLLEVSIGHAIISDALYLGLENSIQMYLRRLGR